MNSSIEIERKIVATEHELLERFLCLPRKVPHRARYFPLAILIVKDLGYLGHFEAFYSHDQDRFVYLKYLCPFTRMHRRVLIPAGRQPIFKIDRRSLRAPAQRAMVAEMG